MVNLTIDGRQISVEENTTIMEAARSRWYSDSESLLSQRHQ